ncbi:MAG: DUF4124 domain-containing protein [Gammaproteobacteria bacterium]|nr:DUF4124 domain-containing protein [Gammaproteobacteria bacterium]MCG3143896.1 hypothetical protein [Gammaproteobacteria bacterium]
MTVRTSLVAVMAIALLGPQAAAREVYKWTDANGKVHYGDRPAAAAAEKIEVRVAEPIPDENAAARDEKTRRLLKQLEQERAEDAEAQARIAEEKAMRRDNCLKARDLLEKYRTATYLYEGGEGKDHRVLTKEERAGAEAAAQKEVDKWCKHGG